MINAIGGYILTVFLLAIASTKPSVAKWEGSLSRVPAGAWYGVALLVAALILEAYGALPDEGSVFGALGLMWAALSALDVWIHEGGHFYLSWAGEVLHVAGGTLFQLLLPGGLLGASLAKDAPRLTFLSLAWIAAILPGISAYVGDARAQKLPLLGGADIHDWNWLLVRFGLASYDTALSRLVWWIGAVIALLACVSFVRTVRVTEGAFEK